MTSALETVLAGLDGVLMTGKQAMALCPAHDDQNPSLSITERDGKVLVHCHAGCPQAEVIGELRARGIWTTGTPRTNRPEIHLLEETYDYLDENGMLLYQVCRFKPKAFRPRRRDGQGRWRWNLGDTRRVPYRLPEILAAPIVFVPEGERDVETLRGWGFCATTNSGGAAGWRAEFDAYFAGKEVIVLPDADIPGRNRAKTIVRSLYPVAKRLIVVELEGAKDVTEWFEQGHAEVELLAQVEECDAV